MEYVVSLIVLAIVGLIVWAVVRELDNDDL